MTKGLCCGIWQGWHKQKMLEKGWCETQKEKLIKPNRAARALQSFQEATKDVFRGNKKKEIRR